MSRCRCGSPATYRRCCGPLHEGKPAPTAVALMRSRYCAYAMGLVDYIIDTTDPAGPAAQSDVEAWRVDVQRFCDSTVFRALEILHHAEQDDVGEVSFVASLVQRREDISFGERSHFTRIDSRWRYHSGAALPSEGQRPRSEASRGTTSQIPKL